MQRQAGVFFNLIAGAVPFGGFIFLFFPGSGFDETELASRKLLGKEPSWQMLIPVLVLTAGAVAFGCFPEPFINLLKGIGETVF